MISSDVLTTLKNSSSAINPFNINPLAQSCGLACANVALIKYMGKDEDGFPINPSLSYALEKYQSKAIIQYNEIFTKDKFQPLNSDNFSLSQYNPDAIKRVLNFLQFIKNELKFNGYFSVQSGNNFPHSAGIASSASSGAAITIALCDLICKLKNDKPLSNFDMAFLSKSMSGSCVRSFFKPWCLYEEKKPQNINLIELNHDLILINTKPKKVSSRTAHELIKTSPIFKNRYQNTSRRLKNLIYALNNSVEEGRKTKSQLKNAQRSCNCVEEGRGTEKPQPGTASTTQLKRNFTPNNWEDAYQICYEEFIEMHEMFKTCSTPFSYMNEKSDFILQEIQKMWKNFGDGPIVTMDAGVNIHLFWRTTALRNDCIKQLRLASCVGRVVF